MPDAVVAKPVAEFYLSNGVLGVSVLVLIIAVVALWRTVEAKNKRIEEVQEARLVDSKSYAAGLLDVHEKWASFQEKLFEKLEDKDKRRGRYVP